MHSKPLTYKSGIEENYVAVEIFSANVSKATEKERVAKRFFWTGLVLSIIFAGIGAAVYFYTPMNNRIIGLSLFALGGATLLTTLVATIVLRVKAYHLRNETAFATPRAVFDYFVKYSGHDFRKGLDLDGDKIPICKFKTVIHELTRESLTVLVHYLLNPRENQLPKLTTPKSQDAYLRIMRYAYYAPKRPDVDKRNESFYKELNSFFFDRGQTFNEGLFEVPNDGILTRHDQIKLIDGYFQLTSKG